MAQSVVLGLLAAPGMAANLASAIASLAGALGSLTESDFAVREAMYRYHPDARTEDREARDEAVSGEPS